jgi:predicted O-methyltransferase YrrM
MNLFGNIFIIQNRLQDIWRYYLRSPDQPFGISEETCLECNTSELGQFIWRRLIPIVGTNPFPPHELMLMSAAMLWLKPKLVVEWGTNVGVSARVFHEANVHYKIGAEIHSIDLPDNVTHREHPKQRRGLLVRDLPVVLHQGNGPVLASSLIHERNCLFPLIFIDGDHARESVFHDTRLVLQAAPAAALLFHDTFYQPKSGYNHGPYEAVQDLLAELGTTAQVITANLGCPGMTLVVPQKQVQRSNANSTYRP